MRVGAAGPHLGGHPDRFHNLLFVRALAHCALGAAAEAIGALSHMRHTENAINLRRKLTPFLRQIF